MAGSVYEGSQVLGKPVAKGHQSLTTSRFPKYTGIDSVGSQSIPVLYLIIGKVCDVCLPHIK